MRGFAARLVLAVAALVLSASATGQGREGPSIAAASDLKFALEEIAAGFTRATGKTVRLSFGSSGNFARQIRQGAPFEMFLSADEAYVAGLVRDGLTRDAGELYAVGRIVLFVPRGSRLKVDATLGSLREALAAGRLGKFAIANPEHAPDGRAAREALEGAGLGTASERHLVLGENVSQAAQFATTGGADGGIFAYSLALSPAVAALGEHALLPASMHKPLRQRMVLLKNAGPVAAQFYAYVAGPAARRVFDRYGFALAG